MVTSNSIWAPSSALLPLLVVPEGEGDMYLPLGQATSQARPTLPSLSQLKGLYYSEAYCDSSENYATAPSRVHYLRWTAYSFRLPSN